MKIGISLVFVKLSTKHKNLLENNKYWPVFDSSRLSPVGSVLAEVRPRFKSEVRHQNENMKNISWASTSQQILVKNSGNK